MERLPLEDAHVLLAQLDRVRRTAITRSSVQNAPHRYVSPPLDELLCLTMEAHDIDGVEGHLWTVGAMALRDIQTRVYMRTWDIGTRSFPHSFERLLRRDPGEQIGDPYPYLVIGDIEWVNHLPHLPAEIWITHREVRLSQGSLTERARTIMSARYPFKVSGWSVRTAHAMGPHEDQIEPSHPRTRSTAWNGKNR